MAEDGRGENRLLVHHWLDDLGDVRGSNWSVNGNGVGLINWDGVWLIHGDGLGDWDRLGDSHQLDSLHGHWAEVTAKTKSVSAETSWGSHSVGSGQDWASGVTSAVTTVDGGWDGRSRDDKSGEY